ncbi:hypothetical protein [Chryseobacterium koreense]
MRNIWFTIYASKLEEFLDLPDYNAVLEILLAIKIQDKINRDKKAQKIMISLSSNMDEDYIEHFVENYYNKKKVLMGIINLPISTKHINWNTLTDKEKKNFLIEKWKVLFNNLSDDYFVVDKSEVIKSLEELKHEEWKLSIPLFKKKLKYNRETYEFILETSPEKADVILTRDSDNKKINLKSYKTRQTMYDTTFKNFKLDGDTLTLENKTFFLPPEVFDLKKILIEN